MQQLLQHGALLGYKAQLKRQQLLLQLQRQCSNRSMNGVSSSSSSSSSRVVALEVQQQHAAASGMKFLAAGATTGSSRSCYGVNKGTAAAAAAAAVGMWGPLRCMHQEGGIARLPRR